MIVVKLGGGDSIDPQSLLQELAALDEPWILVHGGNAEMTRISTQLGHPPRFVTSPSGHESRFNDPQTITHMQMTYRGRINNDLVLRLQRLGVPAVGLSGIDGGILQARRKEAIRVVENGRKMILRGDHSGRVEHVDTRLLQHLIDGGFRPVLTLPALAHDGTAVNVDGDRAAAAVAAALDAELVILTDVPGLLRDVDDPDSLVDHVPADGLDQAQSLATGRFGRKLIAAGEALTGGVARVTIATAHGDRPLQAARAGGGTVIS